MIGSTSTGGEQGFRIGWILVLLTSAVVLLATTYVIASPVDESFFEETTGLAYDEFQAANPKVADNVERQGRLLGLTGAGFAILALATTWRYVRRGDTWAAWLLWVMPLVLAAYTVVFLVDGVTTLAIFYGALAILAAVGLGLVAWSLRDR